MRSAWLLLAVCGCSDPGDGSEVDAIPVDAPADACSQAPEPLPTSGCVPNGLANLSLDGMWTLTGTVNRYGQVMPYTATMYMKRDGTGRCQFELSRIPITDATRDPNVYINDTIATYSYSAFYPHSTSSSWRLCVSDVDGSLVYHSHYYVSMPMQDEYIDGVFTR